MRKPQGVLVEQTVLKTHTHFDSVPYANIRMVDVARILDGETSKEKINTSLLAKLVDRVLTGLEHTIISIQGRPEGTRVIGLLHRSFSRILNKLPEFQNESIEEAVEMLSGVVLSEARTRKITYPKSWEMSKKGRKVMNQWARLAAQNLIGSKDPKEILKVQQAYTFAHMAKGSGASWWEEAENAVEDLAAWLKRHKHPVPVFKDYKWIIPKPDASWVSPSKKLFVKKGGYSANPWRVHSSYDDSEIDHAFFKTKREAVAWAKDVDHLPWRLLYSKWSEEQRAEVLSSLMATSRGAEIRATQGAVRHSMRGA